MDLSPRERRDEELRVATGWEEREGTGGGRIGAVGVMSAASKEVGASGERAGDVEFEWNGTAEESAAGGDD